MEKRDEMKEMELRKHAVCSICGKKIGHTGLPLFWVVEFKRYGINLDALKKQDGLTAMLAGHAALANLMGPDEPMAECIAEAKLTFCEKCAADEEIGPFAALAMVGSD